MYKGTTFRKGNKSFPDIFRQMSINNKATPDGAALHNIKTEMETRNYLRPSTLKRYMAKVLAGTLATSSAAPSAVCT